MFEPELFTKKNDPESLPGYPKINIWEVPPSDGFMKIINREDFPEYDVFKALGISGSPLIGGFGIYDIKEIKSRQDIFRYLNRNPEFAKWLIDQDNKSIIPGSRPDSGGENQFLYYFDPKNKHTPFWTMVHEMVDFLNRDNDLPAKLKEFKEALEKTMHLEKVENDLGRQVGEMIRGIALIEGIATFRVKVEEDGRKYRVYDLFTDKATQDKSAIHGYKKFSQDYAVISNAKFDSNQSLLSHIGLGIISQKLADRKKQLKINMALQETVINQFSNELVNDLKEGVLKILQRLEFENKDAQDSEVEVYFAYSDAGLKVRIFSWNTKDEAVKPLEFKLLKFDGYTASTSEKIENSQEWCNREIIKTNNQRLAAKHIGRIEQQSVRFFNEVHTIDSHYSDKIYRWFALSNLYNTTFKGSFAEVDAHRKFFYRKKKVLKDMSIIMNELSTISKKLNCPLCWPEFVLDGSHIVAFEKMMPIHLIGKKAQLTPIKDVPILNGRILGFTGHHEGGKTVTTLTIAELIFLAQSGLPVFGEGVRLNPKKMVGAVFMSKGEGSTARNLLDKMTKVIEAAKKENPHEVVVIFDELGEGTQEVSGDKLGRDVLTGLSKLGVSVVFNTQITSLAEYSAEKLNAQCMMFTADHKISPGIGTGDMKGLRERSNLDKALAGLN